MALIAISLLQPGQGFFFAYPGDTLQKYVVKPSLHLHLSLVRTPYFVCGTGEIQYADNGLEVLATTGSDNLL